MTRSDGFAIMDVSTSICDEPKFRRIQRQSPELVAVCFTAYLAVMADSWKAARRVSIEDSWPTFLAFDRAAIDVLIQVGLLDSRGRVSAKAWADWFEPARHRRDKARDRWARYNASRDAVTARSQRGSDAVTASSDPSVPSAPSGPTGLNETVPVGDGRYPPIGSRKPSLVKPSEGAA